MTPRLYYEGNKENKETFYEPKLFLLIATTRCNKNKARCMAIQWQTVEQEQFWQELLATQQAQEGNSRVPLDMTIKRAITLKC